MSRATTAARRGIELEVVKLLEAKRGFVLLPERWLVGSSSVTSPGARFYA